MSIGRCGRMPEGRRAALRMLVAGLGIYLGACGSNQALLATRLRTEAEELQAACHRTGLTSAETKQADGHLAASIRHAKEGEEDKARNEADLAVALYRLALVRRELVETQASVDALKSALAKDKDQLQTYQQVLEEVKTKRTP